MKILLTDIATIAPQLSDFSFDRLAACGELVYGDLLTGKKLLQAVRDADAIICNKTVIDKTVLDAAPNLKYIGLFATGYNNIDIEETAGRGITVCNAGTYSTSAVAQQTFAYILSHFSAVEKYSALVHDGAWITSPTFSMLTYPTDELCGKTIGIIGYGSIGKRVAAIAKAFEMKVLVTTRTPKTDGTVTFCDLDTLLAKSDIVTVHCPLNEQSRDLFDAAAFRKMKPGSFFINTARGGVVVEQALADALKSGHLAGAAVDVLRQEPMAADCALLDAPNLIITPHIAWIPKTTRKRLLEIVADNLESYLNGTPKNVVSR